ncbi:hypothetical protein AB0N09_27825 [Streptomyces erythrochromogenes]|uniref:hypothetical protein n=1 Tax=Streptomyces erythrochromogenes TaxID=285574 RepID=UPI003422B993
MINARFVGGPLDGVRDVEWVTEDMMKVTIRGCDAGTYLREVAAEDGRVTFLWEPAARGMDGNGSLVG